MITVPYSLELSAHQDAKAAVAGTTVDTVSGKMKIFLGADVQPDKRQSIVGSFHALYRRLMNHVASGGATGNGTICVFGPWDSATSGNVQIEQGTTNVATGDVAVVCSGTFPSGFAANKGATHFYQETFDQLVEVFLENTKDN
jgi:hypothetical protein